MRLGKAKVQKTAFFYLSLLSPFTIFAGDNKEIEEIRHGKGTDRAREKGGADDDRTVLPT